jgi:RNA polymerase sigma-70 factor (ECF subfamily)
MTAVALAPRLVDPAGMLGLLSSLARWRSEPEEVSPRGSAQIEQLRRRDEESWRTFFAQEMPAIYKYALSRLGNAPDAEDLAGQVFEEAWEHADGLEDRGLPARVWLFGIARNLVSTHRRRWFRQQPALALEAFDAPMAERGMDPELLDLARSIADLAASHAEVISLRFIHGLSLQETAEVLGTSVDGVKGRQARALADLRERLGERIPAASR